MKWIVENNNSEKRFDFWAGRNHGGAPGDVADRVKPIRSAWKSFLLQAIRYTNFIH